ncbi:hypothetical protein [Erwinia sp. S38]|uniref:hypothetical protein n=1 Tax=Erwinia sp. S38 TaxID=2769338 RepID=UPI00190CE044|nr:hypothetical protein [Erwinia sp. S38]MBK0004469.1 hypothetical protein [Erwinia sp. S38]
MYGETKIGILNISPGDGCSHPKGAFYDDYGRETVSGLDWITLASLRDSENSIMSYDEVDDQVSGITMLGKLTEWFDKAGYEKVFDNISLSHANETDIVRLNSFAKQGYRVVTFISAEILKGWAMVTHRQRTTGSFGMSLSVRLMAEVLLLKIVMN